MLSIKELEKLAYEQRERLFKAHLAGTADTAEFFSEAGEAHIAAACLDYLANRHATRKK